MFGNTAVMDDQFHAKRWYLFYIYFHKQGNINKNLQVYKDLSYMFPEEKFYHKTGNHISLNINKFSNILCFTFNYGAF